MVPTGAPRPELGGRRKHCLRIAGRRRPHPARGRRRRTSPSSTTPASPRSPGTTSRSSTAAASRSTTGQTLDADRQHRTRRLASGPRLAADRLRSGSTPAPSGSSSAISRTPATRAGPRPRASRSYRPRPALAPRTAASPGTSPRGKESRIMLKALASGAKRVVARSRIGAPRRPVDRRLAHRLGRAALGGELPPARLGAGRARSPHVETLRRPRADVLDDEPGRRAGLLDALDAGAPARPSVLPDRL